MATSKTKIVLVTCSNRAEARKIAKAVVTRRLAACVNIFSAPVHSVYRWKQKIEMAAEFLLIIKTTVGRLRDLEKEIHRLHSYDLPEFLVIGVDGGSKEYLEWLGENVR